MVEAEPDQPHFVQELGLDVQAAGETWTGEALVPPGAWAPGTRFPRSSVLATYADVIAGSQYRAMTLPRLSVTVDLGVDVIAPHHLHDVVDRLTLTSRVLRQGKRTAVTETMFHVGSGEVVAVCTGSFSMISRTYDGMEGQDQPGPGRFERPLLDVPLAERVGCVETAPGRVEMAMRDDLGNSTGSLMGGLTALLGEASALSRAEAEGGRPFFVDRLQVRYLSPVRIGPARADAMRLGGTSARPFLRVALHDSARPEQLAADITATCLPL